MYETSEEYEAYWHDIVCCKDGQILKGVERHSKKRVRNGSEIDLDESVVAEPTSKKKKAAQKVSQLIRRGCRGRSVCTSRKMQGRKEQLRHPTGGSEFGSYRD